MSKRFLQATVVIAILCISFSLVGGASAWGGCGNSITVQWGDTLSSIATQCGTNVAAIQAANPGLGWWVYAGQVLYMPTGYGPGSGYYPPSGGSYTVQWGDTLAIIAARTGVSWRDILAANPQIYNPSLIYAGQVINMPAGTGMHPSYPTNRPPHQSGCGSCGQHPSVSSLKINYKYGLFVRTEPGGSIIASGRNKSVWYYRPGSTRVDHKGCVWVEVTVFPPVKGYTTGWMLVKDQLGNYFTSPQIGG